MNNFTNTIITAVYLNEWQLIENKLPITSDNAYSAAELMATFVGDQLYRGATAQLPETVDWLINQPYIDKQTFCKWVFTDTLKQNEKMHRIIQKKVAPFCG